MKKEEFDYEALKEKALLQFKTGKSLFGKDGAFAPMLKDFLEAALEEKFESHVDEQERQAGNWKNRKNSKELKTSGGSIEISSPRDRTGSFDPQIVRKRERILAENLEKIYVQDRTNLNAYNQLIEDFKAAEQSPVLELKPLKKPELDNDSVDEKAFQESWGALKDTHGFFPMMREYKISRIHAIHIGGPSTRRVSNKSAEKLLHNASGLMNEIGKQTLCRMYKLIHLVGIRRIISHIVRPVASFRYVTEIS